MKHKKIMAVASRGGHWVQLLRLAPAWDDHNVIYVTNDKKLKHQVHTGGFSSVIDANMDQKIKLLALSVQIFWLIIRHRPDCIISTGAAPGFFAMFWGKFFRIKTIWLDSVANVEELSLAGKKVGPFASVWLTQWPGLETDSGPSYKGRVF